MADGLDGIETSLTKDVGGVPVWVLGAGAGLIVGVAYWIHSRSNQGVVANVYDPNSASTDTSTDPTNSDFGLPNGPAGDWLADNPGSTAFPVGGAALPSPITNGQWARQVIDGLLATGADPTLVTNAITKYIAGLGLSVPEKSVVSLALQKFGSPPEGSLQIIDATPPTTPPATAPSTGSSVVQLQATKISPTSVTITWGNMGRPTFQLVYFNHNPGVPIVPTQHSYTFRSLKPGTGYRFGVAHVRGVIVGPRYDVQITTPSK